MTAEVELFEDQPLAPVRSLPVALASDIDSWVEVAAKIIKLADYICETQFVPKAYRGNAPATAAAILAGRELGLPPMTALRHVQVVEGSPSLSAEYKRARVLAAGHELDIIELNTTRCKVQGRRRGSGKPPLEITFTIQDAKTAQIFKARGAWETRPRRMLFARAATEVCDFLFADITNGLPTTELLAEGGGEDDGFGGYAESPGQAPVDQDGQKPAARTARRQRAAGTGQGTDKSGTAQRAAGSLSGSESGKAHQPAAASPGLPPLPGEEDDTSGPAPTGQPAGHEPAAGPEGRDRHGKLVGIVQGHAKRLGFNPGPKETDEERIDRLTTFAKLAAVKFDPDSTNDFDEDELSVIADTLARCKDRAALDAVLQAGEQQGGDSDE